MLFFLNKWELYKKRQQRRCFSWRKHSDLEHFLSFDLKVTTFDDPQVHPLCDGFQLPWIGGLFRSILKITCSTKCLDELGADVSDRRVQSDVWDAQFPVS